MTQQEIDKPATDSCVIENSIFNPSLIPYYEQGFKDGSKWRINSVWNDSNEKPVLNEFFVYQTDNGEWETDCLLKDRWDLYVVSTKLIRWAYIKDLIPDKEE